jgi:hypothetical protein
MAGKAVVKPVVKAKATGKAVAKAVKKPDVAKAVKPVKAVAKKPAVKAVVKKPTGAKAAKFNFNKLIMLIIRDVPKKGKKMTGGFEAQSFELIKGLIIDFINNHKKRIYDRINDSYMARGTAQNHKDYARQTANYITNDIVATDDTSIAGFHTFVGNITNPLFHNIILDKGSPAAIDTNEAETDKRMHIVNFMRIVIVLCQVYKDYHNNIKGQATIINEGVMPV